MKSFNHILTSMLIMFVSLTAYAGGTSGGGGVMARPEIVFNMGQQNGVTSFAHGTFANGQWQVETLSATLDDLANDAKMVDALEVSKTSNQWAPIQQPVQ